jgi:tetratricopeptide (TPR) repeat protein
MKHHNTVSKTNPKQQPQKPANQPAPALAAKPAEFSIPYPMLWLALAVVILYFPSFSFGFTELDDSIFIKEFQAYNQDTHNLIASFTRGLFDATKDPYYRPLFSDMMILNYQMSGESIVGYHVVNVLLHIGSVLLLYKLFGKLGIKQLQCFILAMIFAVHPVLSQAVAWIPGRNDTMLAVFVLSFFLSAINYSDTGKSKSLLLSGLFLLLAYFTKETAVFAAPAAFILLIAFRHKKWNDRNNLVQYGLWAACFAIWYLARMAATTASSGIGTAQALTDFIQRIPVIIQYIGKIFLPFNLSVFPTQQDTVLYYGIAALVLLAAIIALSKHKNTGIVLGSTGIFLLFLMPALLVPAHLNQQTFEHRLYLPMIGILLLLPQTVLFQNKLADKQLFYAAMGICVVFAGINYNHQKSFADPRTFWTQAVETSPNSAYANMMLAARLDKDEVARSEELFRKAYRLNPKEKYLNFYMGEMLQRKDSVLASEPYLLEEKKGSDYIQCDFYLARVAMMKKDMTGAIGYLENYLNRNKANPMANNNLLLLYVDQHMTDKAKKQIRNMRQMGLDVPATIAAPLGM